MVDDMNYICIMECRKCNQMKDNPCYHTFPCSSPEDSSRDEITITCPHTGPAEWKVVKTTCIKDPENG